MEIAQLVVAVQRGEQAKYRYIIEHYEQKIFATAVRIAEDLVQEIFIKAYHNIHKYEPTSSFQSWLYKLATHHCLDYVKKKKPIPTHNLDIIDTAYPEQTLLLREKEQQLNTLLDEVDITDKAVLLLRYVNELRYDEN